MGRDWSPPSMYRASVVLSTLSACVNSGCYNRDSKADSDRTTVTICSAAYLQVSPRDLVLLISAPSQEIAFYSELDLH